MKMWEMKVRSNRTHKLIDHDYFTNLALALAFANNYKTELDCRVSLKYVTVHA